LRRAPREKTIPDTLHHSGNMKESRGCSVRHVKSALGKRAILPDCAAGRAATLRCR
jgi:hypothetical protein